jgi:hypothetical protein
LKIIFQKLKNLEEVDKFQGAYDLPLLSQDDINNVNRFITSIKIEEVINSLTTKKSPGPE